VADSKEVLMPNASDDPARIGRMLRAFLLEFQSAITAPSRCPFPVIAAVHGAVIGLGVDIISACDIRYAASSTTFIIKVCTHEMSLLCLIGDWLSLGS
jgi:Enoyl-CoA hydratase/carnithine racemase